MLTKFVDNTRALEMQHWNITPLVVVLHQALTAGDSAPWPPEWDHYIARPQAVAHGLEHLFKRLREFENDFDLITLPQPSEEYLRQHGFLISPPAQPQPLNDAGQSPKEGGRQ